MSDSSPAAHGSRSVTVYGVVAVPELTNRHTFTPDTSFEEASKKVFESANERYSKYAGEQPKYTEEHISASISSFKNKKLRDLVADQHPLPVSIVRVLKDSSLLHNMEASAAAGRAALAENVSLMYQIEQQPQLATKKGKKQKKTAAPAPVDSVPTSPDDLSRLVSQLVSQVNNLQQELVEVKEETKQRLVKVEEDNAELKEDNAELKEELAEVKEDNAELKEELAEVKEDNAELKVRVDSLQETRKAMWDIYRRMVLDQARIRILDVTGINRGDLGSSVLLAAVKARLPNPFALDDVALRMIFLTGPVRQRGNNAAHEGREDFIALSVLGSDLSNSERTTLTAVYKYVYGVEPTLG